MMVSLSKVRILAEVKKNTFTPQPVFSFLLFWKPIKTSYGMPFVIQAATDFHKVWKDVLFLFFWLIELH